MVTIDVDCCICAIGAWINDDLSSTRNPQALRESRADLAVGDDTVHAPKNRNPHDSIKPVFYGHVQTVDVNDRASASQSCGRPRQRRGDTASCEDDVGLRAGKLRSQLLLGPNAPQLEVETAAPKAVFIIGDASVTATASTAYDFNYGGTFGPPRPSTDRIRR